MVGMIESSMGAYFNSEIDSEDNFASRGLAESCVLSLSQRPVRSTIGTGISRTFGALRFCKGPLPQTTH